MGAKLKKGDRVASIFPPTWLSFVLGPPKRGTVVHAWRDDKFGGDFATVRWDGHGIQDCGASELRRTR